MRRRWLLPAAAIAAALALGGALWLRGGPAPAGRFGAGAPAPRLPPGAARSYRWSLTTVVTPAGPGEAPHETTYQGRLNVRVLPGEAAMAVQLSPLSVRVMGEPDPRLEKAFSTPFAMAIDDEGRFGASRFPEGLAGGDRAVLDGAIRSLQIVVPRGAGAQWETVESDQNGDFVASYRLEGGPGGIAKSRLRYTALRMPGLFSVRVVSSAVRAQVDPAGPWLARAEGAERLQLEAQGGQPLAQVEARFALEPAGEAPAADLAIRDDAAVRAMAVPRDAPSTGASAWDEAEAARQRARFAAEGVTLDALVAGLSTHPPQDAVFAHRFADYLRAFPDEASRLAGRFRSLSDTAASLLFNVLELAGTPQAQAVLAGAMEDRGESKANRFRALVAIAGIRQPTADTVERVRRAAVARGAGGADDLATTALLTLGSLAPNAPAGMGSAIVGELREGLRAAADPGAQARYLGALANARAELAPGQLAGYLQAESPAVRAAAVDLVAARQDPGGARMLADRLAAERDPSVRSAVVAGLSRQPPSAVANDAVARMVADGREPDAAVRAQMVAYLARQAPAFPSNREVLQSQLRRETNRDVIVAILNALSR